MYTLSTKYSGNNFINFVSQEIKHIYFLQFLTHKVYYVFLVDAIRSRILSQLQGHAWTDDSVLLSHLQQQSSTDGNAAAWSRDDWHIGSARLAGGASGKGDPSEIFHGEIRFSSVINKKKSTINVTKSAIYCLRNLIEFIETM